MRIGQKLKRQLGFLMSVLCAVSLVACGTKYADAPALQERYLERNRTGKYLWEM